MASAAEMIRRFREDMPTSKLERNSSRKAGKIDEMWWMADASNDPKLKISGDFDINTRKKVVDMSSDAKLYDSNIRISNDFLPKNKISTYDIGTKDYRRSVNFGRDSWDGFKAVEDLIANDIRRLELSTKSSGIDLTSGLRSNTRTNMNNTGDLYDLRISNDFLRSSNDTLGNTGFRGLLIPELKLDGKKIVVNEPPKQENVGDVNANMEELLKSLGGYNPHSLENYDLATPFSTIIQVADKLQTDLISFSTFYEKKYAQEAEEEEERKKESEALIEEGRRAEREARNQTLIDENQFPDPALDFVGLLQELDENHEYIQSSHDNPKDGMQLGGIASARLSLEEATELSRIASYPPTLPPNTDMNTTTLSHMQTLRKQLTKRISKLDDLHAIAMRRFPPQHGNLTSYNDSNANVYFNHYKFPKGHPQYHQLSNPKADNENDTELNFKTDWNPYPDLVHENILTTDVAIGSMLDSAMQTLHLRLPSPEDIAKIEKWKTSDHYNLPMVYLDRNKPPLSMLDPKALSLMESLRNSTNPPVIVPPTLTNAIVNESETDVANHNNDSDNDEEEMDPVEGEEIKEEVADIVVAPSIAAVTVTEADLKELDALLGEDATFTAVKGTGIATLLSNKKDLRPEDVGLPPLGPSSSATTNLPIQIIQRRDPSAVSSLLRAREDRKKIVINRETAYHRPPSAPPKPVTVSAPSPAIAMPEKALHSYDSESDQSLSPPPTYGNSHRPPSNSTIRQGQGRGVDISVGVSAISNDSSYRRRPPEGLSLRNVRNVTKSEKPQQINPTSSFYVNDVNNSLSPLDSISKNSKPNIDSKYYQYTNNYYENNSPNKLNYSKTDNYNNKEFVREAILYTPKMTSNGKVLVRHSFEQRQEEVAPKLNNALQSSPTPITSISDRQAYLNKMKAMRAGYLL